MISDTRHSSSSVTLWDKTLPLPTMVLGIKVGTPVLVPLAHLMQCANCHGHITMDGLRTATL